MSIRMSCPTCHATQEETNFNISASAIFEVSKYGTEDFVSVEWSDDSAMQCRNCGHLGKVRGFMHREEADA